MFPANGPHVPASLAARYYHLANEIEQTLRTSAKAPKPNCLNHCHQWLPSLWEHLIVHYCWENETQTHQDFQSSESPTVHPISATHIFIASHFESLYSHCSFCLEALPGPRWPPLILGIQRRLPAFSMKTCTFFHCSLWHTVPNYFCISFSRHQSTKSFKAQTELFLCLLTALPTYQGSCHWNTESVQYMPIK